MTLAAERARERWREGLAAADLEVTFVPPPGLPRPSDGMSGGTFQSLAAVADRGRGALITDPAVLITDAAVAAAVRRYQSDRAGATARTRRGGDRADGAGAVHQPGGDPPHARR